MAFTLQHLDLSEAGAFFTNASSQAAQFYNNTISPAAARLWNIVSPFFSSIASSFQTTPYVKNATIGIFGVIFAADEKNNPVLKITGIAIIIISALNLYKEYKTYTGA